MTEQLLKAEVIALTKVKPRSLSRIASNTSEVVCEDELNTVILSLLSEGTLTTRIYKGHLQYYCR